MSKSRLSMMVVGVVAAGTFADGASAQWSRSDVGWCDERWGNRDDDRHCFVLEGEFQDFGRLLIDGGSNGGVEVEGWGRDVVAVRAKVWANARTSDQAREIADDVRVRMDDGRLFADGPDTGRNENWGVSFEVMVPNRTDLDIETHNGGISVTEVSGSIDFRAVNGGVNLVGLSGDVVGRTTNGGLKIELEGSRWDGRGLDVETTNGGVTLLVPPDYSADLETRTVNGGIDLDFPVTVQGRLGRRLEATLGEGGPAIRAVTTNGGVRIRHAGRSARR